MPTTTPTTICSQSFLLIFLLLQFCALSLGFTYPRFDDNNHTHILQDVLKEISGKQKWNISEIRFSKSEVKKVRIGTGQRYQFRIGFEDSRIVLKFPDEVGSWRKLSKRDSNFGDFVKEVNSIAVLDSFKLEGPFELVVDGDHRLSLSLPLNTSHSGLKRVLVGEGITVEVKGAQDVSFFYNLRHGLPVNEDDAYSKERSGFWPFKNSFCRSLLAIRVSGPASLVAYRTRNPDVHIETTHLSREAIELLSEKCYIGHIYKQAHMSDSLRFKMVRLENILRNSLGNRTSKIESFGSLTATLESSTIIRFQLELERDIGTNENLHKMLAEWKTRPTIERVWFEVLARVEAEKLKPLLVKKVTPFIKVDSAAWSTLMSNISFTKFPSILVPQEALTLDIKW